MKTRLQFLSKTLVAALAAGLCSAFLATAAEGPPRGRPEPSERGRAGGIGLDEQQRQLLREAMQKDRQQLADLGEKLRAAQGELMRATLAPNFDEKVVRQKAETVAKVQADLTVLRARAFATVVPSLKPEQREQLENSPMGAAMLSGGWMDFGGRRGEGAPPRGDRGGGREGRGQGRSER